MKKKQTEYQNGLEVYLKIWGKMHKIQGANVPMEDGSGSFLHFQSHLMDWSKACDEDIIMLFSVLQGK